MYNPGPTRIYERFNDSVSKPLNAQAYPLEVPVYSSVHGAPFGHTTPAEVHAILSVEVFISMPTPVAGNSYQKGRQ